MQKVTIFETLLDTLSFYRNFLHYIVVFFNCYLLLHKFQSQAVHHHADT